MKTERFSESRLDAHAGLMVTVFGVAILLLGLATAQAYTMAWEYNSFGSGLGSWDYNSSPTGIAYNNTANGNNVDWLNSNLAGGTAGEVGGTVARCTSSAFIGRLLDNPITLNDAMRMRGVFSCANTFLNWNNSVYIGYFNTTDALADSVGNDYVGWRVREPNDGPTALTGYRARAQINVNNVTLAQQSSPNKTYAQGTSYSFDVQWIPSGLNNGAGTLTGNIGPYNLNQAVAAQANVGSFDAFGLFWDESATDPNVKFNAYFDSLEYLVPIPEPSTGLLALLGFAGLWLGNRVRSGRR